MKRWQLSIFSQRVTKQESHCSGFWATVCKIVHPMRTDRCLSCLSVCLSVCEVGVLWQNGYMDQDETWDAGRPRPWPRCVRWGGACSPSPKRGRAAQFSAHVYCGQTAGWIKMPRGREVGLSPSDIVLDGDPAPPPQKGSRAPSFRPMYCGQTAEWTKVPLGMEVGLSPVHIVLDGDPAPPPPKGGGVAQFLAHICCGQMAG